MEAWGIVFLVSICVGFITKETASKDIVELCSAWSLNPASVRAVKNMSRTMSYAGGHTQTPLQMCTIPMRDIIMGRQTPVSSGSETYPCMPSLSFEIIIIFLVWYLGVEHRALSVLATGSTIEPHPHPRFFSGLPF
jgi:hypothetical protein